MNEFRYTKALVLGASEVGRMARLLDQSPCSNLEKKGFCFRKGFGISEAVIRVFGVGGRTVDKTRQYDLWVVELFQPEIVILHLGGNDLSARNPSGEPEVVGNDLLQLCDQLISQFGVAKVLISAFTPCCPPYCDRDYPDNYNERVDAINAFLADEVRRHPAVYLWDHRVAWCYHLVDPDDGVHFNTAGNKRWYKSLQRALLTSLRDRPILYL